MKKKELKRIILDFQNQLYECERYALQLKRERDDAIQKREAKTLVMGEQAGPGPQVDREVRIGGEEEAQEKEEERLISALSTLYDSTRGNTTDGDQENTERPDDASWSGVNPQRIYGQPEGFSVGYWSHSDRAQREAAERQAGILAGDGERERTD